jgi:single-strand DNA-binding protein
MSNLNSVTLSGRLTRDPELKHLPSGTAVAELGLAVNRSVKDESEDSGWRDEASFFDCSLYGKRGEIVAAKGRKGDFVTLLGRLQQRRWEADDGTKREKVSVVVENIEGELFYRSAEESGTAVAESAPASQSDDIPF